MSTPVHIVDISSFVDLEDDVKQKLAADFVTKFSTNGFIGIKGHGLDLAYVSAAFRMSRSFFGLALSEKMKAPHPKASKPHRGYSAPGTGKTNLPDAEADIEAAGRRGKLAEYKVGGTPMKHSIRAAEAINRRRASRSATRITKRTTISGRPRLRCPGSGSSSSSFFTVFRALGARSWIY